MSKPGKHHKKSVHSHIPRRNLQRESLREIMRVLRAFDMQDCWSRLSEKSRHKFTSTPYRVFRFEKDSKSDIERKVIDAFKRDIKDILDNEVFEISSRGTGVTLRDFHSAGIMLHDRIEEAIDESNPDFQRWKALYDELHPIIGEETSIIYRRIEQHMCNLIAFCTSIDHAYYHFNRGFHLPTREQMYACIVYQLTKTPAQRKLVTIDGKPRPVFRVGRASYIEVQWASLEIPQGEQSTEEPVKIPIYIQSHALFRLYERLTPLPKAMIQILLYEVFFEGPELSTSPTGDGFITFYYDSVKLGYLVYEIIDAMVVIKTFLFITQNGTLEGNALSKAYALSRYSKAYFELDRLYTFTNTDIYHDEELKALFSDCGCGGLFNMWTDDHGEPDSFDKNYAKNLKKIFLTAGNPAVNRLNSEPIPDQVPR